MDKGPKISVIVPVYNVERYLETCLLSVLSQTYRTLEIILINDGSNDESFEICKKLAKLDNRIIIFNQSNQGLSATRNRGLQIATGRYILFIDSDDFIDPNMIEVLYSNLVNENADISLCTKRVLRIEKNTIEKHKKIYRVFDKNKAVIELLKSELFDFGVTDKLFPKEFFNDIDFELDRINEDYVPTTKVFLKAEKIVYDSRPLYFYRKRAESITTKAFSSKRLDILHAMNQIKVIIKNYDAKIMSYYNRLDCIIIMRLAYDLISLDKNQFHSELNILIYRAKQYRKDLFINRTLSLRRRFELLLFFTSPVIYTMLRKRLSRAIP